MFEQLNIFDFIEEDLDSIIESKSIHHNIHFGRINYWYSHPTELNKHGELYERDIEKNCFFCGYQFISRDEVKMIMPKIGADYRWRHSCKSCFEKGRKIRERRK